MKTKKGLTRTIFALATAVGVMACSAQNDADKDPHPVVVVETSMGSFKVKLDREKSPITVNNFLKYVDKKHYDNTVFHRVMSDFMIQGGGFEKGDIPTEKETMDPIRNEAKTNGLKNKKYSIAMARTPNPHSATSQFFINVADNQVSLDPHPTDPRRADGYAAFGEVIEGMDVVDKIKGVEVATKKLNSRQGSKIRTDSHQNVPVKPVVIKTIRLEKKKEAMADEKKEAMEEKKDTMTEKKETMVEEKK